MLTVPHLDREFDYLVSADQSDDAQPGVRVRVRFHGRLVDAFVLERRSDTDHVGKLGWLDKVVSAERVLTHDVRRLVDAVAARYAGTRADVLRLAVPPRHANVEKKPPPQLEPFVPGPAATPIDTDAAWAAYGGGAQFLAALRDGRAARAVWQALPGESWSQRLAEAAAVDRELGSRGAGRRARSARCGRAARRGRRPRGQVESGRAVGGPGTRGTLPALAVGAARRRAAGDRHAQRGFRAGRRPGAGDGVGRRRRFAGRAAGAVPARPRGGDAARSPTAVRGADRRLRAHRRSAGAGPQRLGARPDGARGSRCGLRAPRVVALEDSAYAQERDPAARTARLPSVALDAARGGARRRARRCWCRCPGAAMCPRWRAAGAAPSPGAGTARVRCRCPAATPRCGLPVVRPRRSRRCGAPGAAPTRCAPSSSAPAAPPRNWAGRSPAPR